MAVILTIKVVPSSSRQRWLLDKNGMLKCYLISAPEAGKANRELIKLLSKTLHIPQAALEIISGATIRTKKILIQGQFTQQQILKLLLGEVQDALF